MKPFKFRVWHKPSRTWVSTDIVLSSNGKAYMCTSYENLDITDNKYFEISYSTGFFDKNGKEIFVGYIIKSTVGDSVWIVKFEERDFSIYCELVSPDTLFKFTRTNLLFSSYEIIGNRFENPELLEVLK